MNKGKNDRIYGYTGKILRINLTDSSTEILDTFKYAPEKIGGRMLATRIWWDEVKGPVSAFDPQNKLIFMSGPGCGTAMPCSSRMEIVGVGAAELPESFTYGGIGGSIGTWLKYAGYDGIIIEGKAPKHTYVFINDDKVEFLDADPLWGTFTSDAQDKIKEILGDDVHSMVIGPAGENLLRNAAILTDNDSAAAKTGYGAVFGSKNLKAVAVRGTGTVQPADVEKVLEIRANPSNHPAKPNPATPSMFCSTAEIFAVATGNAEPRDTSAGASAISQTPCMGCNDYCSRANINVPDPLREGEKYAMIGKCIDACSYVFENDCMVMGGSYTHSHAQEKPGAWSWISATITDPTGPDVAFLSDFYPGDKMGYWTDGETGRNIGWLCNQYGMDKWETLTWTFAWLCGAYKEGLLQELDPVFGPDGLNPSKPDDVLKIMHMIVYREGIGDTLAEGMARAIRKFGKKKYGDVIYPGRANGLTGEPLEIPMSIEACWGHSSHWLGRGWQACHKYEWLTFAIGWMVSTRDTSPGQHPCIWVEEMEQFKDDPCHSDLFVDIIERNLNICEIKDATISCDFRSPNPTWPTFESELFTAATGIETTQEELEEKAVMNRLQMRAILMRDYNRTRDMEVEAIFPYLTWPDPWGMRVNWNEFNDLVDKFYEKNGWDLATGWPYRSTWEKYGLKDVADEMEKLGKLPPEGGTPGYTRKEWPLPEINCPVKDDYRKLI